MIVLSHIVDQIIPQMQVMRCTFSFMTFSGELNACIDGMCERKKSVTERTG